MSKESAHNHDKRHLRDILLLFCIPIGIVALMIAFLYIPRFFANPTYDFIYCSGSACETDYDVNESGEISEAPETTSRFKYRDPGTLHYYDSERDSTRSLTIDEAKKFTLSEESRSPDGYALKSHRDTGGPFSAGYQDSWSLSKGLISKPITLAQQTTNNSFIGWVVP